MKQIPTICCAILFFITSGSQQLHAQSDTSALPKTQELKTVTVTGQKQFIEQRIDRTVINVRNSISNVGTTALDVLERSPGVIVNRQSNIISMAGKDGVVVMINGKINYMPVTAVLQLLQGMNAANIERIELITTPPANLDAEGNAGYINIVLVNNPNMGFNGSYSFTMGYGRGEAPAASVNFNYRTQRINLYGDYSFSRLHQTQYLSNYRQVQNQGLVTETITETHRNPVQQNNNIRLGLDWQPTGKTVIGALVAAYDNRWSMDAVNNVLLQKNGQRDTSIIINNDEVNHWRHFMTNLNLQHTFKNKHVLTVNGNYLYYKDNNPTNYSNLYHNSTGDFLFEELTKSDKATPINIWVGSADYSLQPGKKTQVEAGIKGVYSKFINDVLVQSLQQNDWVTDPSLSAKYFLKEKIGAAYVSANISANSKTTIKAGLRYEYTVSNLGTATVKDIVDRKYGRLFPSFFITRKLNGQHALSFSYSKRITRPTFNDMAPFVIFLDPNTFFSGNPALQPSITDVIKTDYSFKKYLLSLAYSYEDDAITGFQPQVDTATNKQLFGARNLHYRKTVSLTLSIPVDITGWWNMQNNIVGNWQEVNAAVNKNDLTLHQAYVNLSATWRFKLPKQFTAELSGFYQSKSLAGASVIKAYGSLNAGVQRKFNRNTLSLTGNNILNTMKFRIITDRPEQHFFVFSRIERFPPIFRLTWSRTFGKNTLKEKRNRTTGSEEEGNRVKQ
jgi:hypothetical protein